MRNLSLVAAFLASTSMAQAATLNLAATAQTQDASKGFTQGRFTDQSVDAVQDTSTGTETKFTGSAISVINTPTMQGASASYSYDLETGEMKATATANTSEFRDVSVGSGIGNASLRIQETFTASTDGFVKLFLDVEGIWGATPFYTQPNTTAIQAQLSAARVFGSRFSAIDVVSLQYSGTQVENLSDPKNLIIRANALGGANRTMELGFDVMAGATYSLTKSLSLGTRNGAIDFSNTATFRFETSDGLDLAFSDSRFLTNMQAASSTGSVSPVPLPASAWTLLAGFGALGALRQVRRTRS